MKKIFLVTVAMMLLATISFAADVIPIALELSCEEVIYYPFDGTVVDITFDVVGKPAKMYLVINTQLAAADKPEDLRNGYLGWHYVNKIDTTVYVSSPFSKVTGDGQTVPWDGYGNENDLGLMVKNAETVAPGTYDYYLFGYDNVNPRTKICEFIPIGWQWQGHFSKIQETDETGMPLDNPLLYGGVGDVGCKRGPDGDQYMPMGMLFKWTMGSDPNDQSQMQTSSLESVYPKTPDYSENQKRTDFGPPQIDPTDHSTMYWIEMNHERQEGALVKFNFVDGGVPERVDDWGGPDICNWPSAYHKIGGNRIEELGTDDDYFYAVSPGQWPLSYRYEWVWAADYEGEKVGEGRWLIDDSYEPDHPDPTFINAMVKSAAANPAFPGKWMIGGGESCFHEMLDMSRLTAGLTDDFDIMWFNKNGDLHLDRHWDPDIEDPWVCNALMPANENGGRTAAHCFDDNFFMVAFLSYHGKDSITISTQDGSGIDYGNFVDDTSDSHFKKCGGWLVDNGSIFDGIYVIDTAPGGGVRNAGSTNQVPFDSCHGIISSVVGVEEEAAAAFSVAQNTPNPFNPTTTISYKLAEAGDVTVDIYNVAGQKIDTLVNEFKTKGPHSIVWDASGFSAGVYFFTVKTSDFSKTMKMTLLK